jgi:hypothetical protein
MLQSSWVETVAEHFLCVGKGNVNHFGFSQSIIRAGSHTSLPPVVVGGIQCVLILNYVQHGT